MAASLPPDFFTIEMVRSSVPVSAGQPDYVDVSAPAAGFAFWPQRHPLLALILALLVLFGGLLAVGRLPINPPSFGGYPQIHVRIHDPGVPAATMEERVTRPLEQILADVPGLADIESVSEIGSSEVVVFVDAGHDTDAVVRDVTERLAQVREKLPATIDAPQLTRYTGVDLPAAELLLGSSTLTLAQLQKWAEDNLIPQFTDIPGFARYEIVGGPAREIQVIPDQRRLAALGLALEDVVNVLRRYKAQAISRGQIDVTQANTQTVDALTLRLANGDTVALSEVARVQEVMTQDGARVYRDDAPVLRLSLYRQPGASTFGVAEAFKARLAWLRANTLIPQTVRVSLLANPLIGLKRMGRGFLTLSLGVWLLTLVLIGVLYRHARAVLLGAATAIISPMLVFAFYKLAGLAINALSLGGMVVGYAFVLGLPLMAFDMLRHPPPGVDPTAARQRVTHRLLTVLMMALLVLVPVWLFGGLPGLVFQALVTGLLATVIASVLVSLVWVPAYAGRPAPFREMPWASGYVQVLARLQRTPRLLATLALLALVVIPVGFYHARDSLHFLPPQDSGEVQLRMTLPAGHDLEQVGPVLRTIEGLARRNGKVDGILTQIGSGNPETTEAASQNEVVMRIELQAQPLRRRSTATWSRDFQRLLAAAPLAGMAVRVTANDPPSVTAERFEDPVMLAATGEICLRVHGPDREVLAGIGARMLASLAVQPGLLSVRLASGGGQKGWVVQANPEHAADEDFDDITMARVLRIAQGGLLIGSVPDAGRGVSLRVSLPPSSGADELPRLLLHGETHNRGAVYLNDVASGHITELTQARWREQQRPMVEIRATLAADASPGRVVHNLQAMLQQTALPPGYQGTLLGFVDSMQRSLKHVLVLLAASFLLLLLLGLRLRTAGGVLLILVNVLLAFAGVVAGIAWTGQPLSLPMGLGALLLVVVGAVPPLLVVDTLRSMRGSASVLDASTAQRMGRPMLVFGISGLLSLLPLASGLVPGFELLQPLAQVLSVGLCFSLLGALFFIPVLYPGGKR